MTEETNSRNKLRELTLGRQAQFKKKMFDYYHPIVEGDEVIGYEEEPIKVEFRQPTIKERNELVNACRNPDTGRFDELEFVLQAALRFTYDPASGQRLFEKADYAALSSQPAGGFVDQFGEEALSIVSLGKPQNKDSRNLEKTRNSKSSI